MNRGEAVFCARVAFPCVAVTTLTGETSMSARVEIRKDIMRMGEDIVTSQRFDKARLLRHHTEDDSVASHSISTAEYALRISRWLERRGVRVNEVDAVRASLMHDLGMTEDEVFESKSSDKAYLHPEEGTCIAYEEFDANLRQMDAVLHHMWPVVGKPPRSSEGWVLVAADKVTSINEVRQRAQRMIKDSVADQRPKAKVLKEKLPSKQGVKKKLRKFSGRSESH